ncbi:Global transcription regulator sge1 [Pleurotus ostreatus]|nr:Global transcription regulator sge1 [Pleurotus ostreatus]
MITSGSVFVFDEDESGIKRWTDGFFWSPSRILGNFLLYRETEKKGAGHRGRAAAEEVNDESQYNVEGVKVEGQSLSRPKSDVSHLGVDRQRERTLVGSLTNSYKFKPNGLMKKTFSLTIEGVAQHLISYYRVEDVENGRLRSPSSLPELASLDISPEYLDRTHFRIAPKVEIGIDGRPRYRGEADDIETSPQPITAPLSSGLPLLTDGRITEGTSAAKRNKRFEPYGSPPMQKRVRKSNKLSNSADGEDSPSEAQQPSSSTASTSVGPQNQPPASASYADPNNVAATAPAPTPYPYGVGVPGYYQVPGYPMPPMYPPGMYPPPLQAKGLRRRPRLNRNNILTRQLTHLPQAQIPMSQLLVITLTTLSRTVLTLKVRILATTQCPGHTQHLHSNQGLSNKMLIPKTKAPTHSKRPIPRHPIQAIHLHDEHRLPAMPFSPSFHSHTTSIVPSVYYILSDRPMSTSRR